MANNGWCYSVNSGHLICRSASVQLFRSAPGFVKVIILAPYRALIAHHRAIKGGHRACSQQHSSCQCGESLPVTTRIRSPGVDHSMSALRHQSLPRLPTPIYSALYLHSCLAVQEFVVDILIVITIVESRCDPSLRITGPAEAATAMCHQQQHGSCRLQLDYLCTMRIRARRRQSRHISSPEQNSLSPS